VTTDVLLKYQLAGSREVEKVRGENGQLEGLRSFFVTPNNSEMSWFNSKFAGIAHRAAKLSL
jgi:hypothetical protein